MPWLTMPATRVGPNASRCSPRNYLPTLRVSMVVDLPLCAPPPSNAPFGCGGAAA